MCSHYTVDGAVKALKAAPEPAVLDAIERRSARKHLARDYDAASRSVTETTPSPHLQHEARRAGRPAGREMDAEPADGCRGGSGRSGPDRSSCDTNGLERLAIRRRGCHRRIVVDGWALKFDRQARTGNATDVAANKAAAKREHGVEAQATG